MTIDNTNLSAKISQAETTLDRNINFITTCDNKASIVLAFTSVLITIYLTSENLTFLKTSIEAEYSNKIAFIAITTMLIISLVLLIVGVSMLILVLRGKVNVSKKPSIIFLTGIAAFDKNTFYEKFRNLSDEEYLQELLNQIYINGKIGTQKYKLFNSGIFHMSLGLGIFIISNLILLLII